MEVEGSTQRRKTTSPGTVRAQVPAEHTEGNNQNTTGRDGYGDSHRRTMVIARLSN